MWIAQTRRVILKGPLHLHRRLASPCIVSGHLHRRLSSSVTPQEEKALDDWISKTSTARRTFYDDVAPSKVADLYCTLPTRTPADRSEDDYAGFLNDNSSLSNNDNGVNGPPAHVVHLSGVHCLAFFHPRRPEAQLGQDGTDRDFCPPPPFTRRMWAGGAFRFPGPGGSRRTLKVGEDAVANVRIGKIEKKGFDKGTPMVFVHQNIDYASRKRGALEAPALAPAVSEERIHVYLPREFRANARGVREVSGLPRPQYTFSWTPTATTLFRFSALTWNGHLIHLDPEYARNEEGYPERLVHGPLTALMLIEGLSQIYRGRIDNFVYRARNPTIVGRRQHLHVAANLEQGGATLWSEDDDGVVGMTGTVDLVDGGLPKL